MGCVTGYTVAIGSASAIVGSVVIGDAGTHGGECFLLSPPGVTASANDQFSSGRLGHIPYSRLYKVFTYNSGLPCGFVSFLKIPEPL